MKKQASTQNRRDNWAGILWCAIMLKDYEHIDRDLVLLAVEWISFNREENGMISVAPLSVIERKTRGLRTNPLDDTIESMVLGRWIYRVAPDTYELSPMGKALLEDKREATVKIGIRLSSWFRANGIVAGRPFTNHERVNRFWMRKIAKRMQR